MKTKLNLAVLLCAVLLPAGGNGAETSALLSNKDLLELQTRVLQLMESGTLVIPELGKAGAPIVENTRQAGINLKVSPASSAFNYTFLTNLRAYLLLADSVPKPFPFPSEAAHQFAELRDSLNRLESHFRALLDQKESQLRSPDRDNLRRYAEANLKVPAAAAGRTRVVFMGDSITDYWRLNEYFPDQDFVNRGISGQVTGEMLGRFKADVLDLKPDAVLILAGTNDLARGTLLSTIENNYTMMANLADYAKIKVIFAAVLPISDYHQNENPAYARSAQRPPAQIRALNDWLRAFCLQRGYIYADYYAATVDAAGFLKAEYADDGLHPNAAGYRIIAPVALDAIEKATGSVQQKTKRRRLIPLGAK